MRFLSLHISVLTMRDEMNVMCCKSVGTDLSMMDIDDFITEISQLKKEVALLETKLRSRGDEGLKRKDVGVVCCATSTECLDSVWISSRDQITPQPLLDSKLSEEKSRHTQDSDLSLTLLCYTESNPTDAQETVCDSNQDLQDEESTDQTSTESLDSVCNAGEQQQILQTTLKMCSVKLIDCRNLMEEMRRETTEEEHHTEDDDDADFIPSEETSDSCSVRETSSTVKKRRRTHSCITCGKTLASKQSLKCHERKHTEQKLFTCATCEISFTTLHEKELHLKLHMVNNKFPCQQCRMVCASFYSLNIHMRTHSGEKPFHCTECDTYFSTKGSLVIHQKNRTHALAVRRDLTTNPF
nr:zinc finger protein 37-like isoform X2 [Misgurnus anguillicaudatus]